ncbi:ABC transporter substrate-binding protein [Rubrobacter tropicus]|uniref:ABC transporter substrate-binding protein n=1 Tax=Rubrobacter tropicus TaxID=2653851 RepID=UPI001D184FBD|nr:iron-siderophore ABC transporter substrate-binding protein [Rubrobacter tropicus]
MIWIKDRLSAVVFLAAALALAACGGAGGQGGDGGGASAQTRTIEHAMGETKIQGTAKRVVVLDTGELDSAMSLGVKPVGAVEAVEGLGLPSYLEGAGGIENVGTIEEPNLEKIATLNPDLILSSKLRHEQIYDQLSQVAPTVFTETTGVTWKENFEKHAEAMNRADEAKEVMDGYEDRLEEFKRAMGGRLGETEVSVVRFLPGETRVYQKESFVGTVLEDAGLPRPPSQDVDDFAILNASEETIPEMDGDAIFVTAYGPQDETTRQKITSDPLWQKLEAVRQDRVYEASDDLWMLGIGPTAANGVVDDLEKHLAES